MRFSIPVFLAAAGISTAFASPVVKAREEIGSFDTFTDENCSEGGAGIDVTSDNLGYTYLNPGIKSIDSHLPDNCALIIWIDHPNQPPYLSIPPSRANQCITLEIDSSRLFWVASCN
ncbi:hypothetical protein GL218_06560 [Daldinia childiae]|uniref:uncharacterized protein n=1 Tax=Daldinia childiae TaxID=326645 RepID=UPI0014465ECF|nr:uncharacterized protein GL218_06560 [Daldinia childiae]KAF3056212.1 hypothetical protein GL218_06560 [Daldinia childiae]